MNLPYVVWCPQQGFANESGGIKVLHRFCHELNCIGQRAYITSGNPNPNWNTPRWQGNEDFIAIYPEIVLDNPLNSNHVVRYILYKQSRPIPEGEIFISFMSMFNSWNLPEDHILYLPVIETDIFVDLHQSRADTCVYYGKGADNTRIAETSNSYEITKAFTLNLYNLRNILNQTEILYTYDNMTAMNEIARLCGCPVVIVPDGSFTKEEYKKHELGLEGLGFGISETNWASETVNSDRFHEKYQDLINNFHSKLPIFVDYTQNMQIGEK